MMTDEEYFTIKMVCERYGYGNVMTLASVLWEIDMEKKGMPTDGIFMPATKPHITERGKRLAQESGHVYRILAEQKERNR